MLQCFQICPAIFFCLLTWVQNKGIAKSILLSTNYIPYFNAPRLNNIFFRPSGNAHARPIIASETKQKNHVNHFIKKIKVQIFFPSGNAHAQHITTNETMQKNHVNHLITKIKVRTFFPLRGMTKCIPQQFTYFNACARKGHIGVVNSVTKHYVICERDCE